MIPTLDVVGLPDAAVKESRERVRAAIKNSGFAFPVSRITVNLAPADRKKVGTVYDLPILVGILAAGGQISLKKWGNAVFLGELSLTGTVRPVTGMLPMALAARRAGIEVLFVPSDNAPEATLAEGLTVYPVEHLTQLVRHLTGEAEIHPAEPWAGDVQEEHEPDFCEVKGQENVKRALEIAAAGGHNIIMSGPPGSGKSMLARRLPSILPDMTRKQALEATEIYSVLGLTSREHPMVTRRPFRSPHHTVSAAGMTGGGSNPRPGEISLAHNGVLFLDELPEFQKDVLEVLRQPMEDGQVQISRAAGTTEFPSRFMLVCAMNPCKCGWYDHPSGRCRCRDTEVGKYLSRLSGPLLDRIDLSVEVTSLEFEELAERDRTGETSAQVKQRVNRARQLQNDRFGESGTDCNAHMTAAEVQRYCALDGPGEALMKGAFERMGLTARSYDKILKVARTIADLDESSAIESSHLAEAIQYRGTGYLRR